jgi:hypothetical protein
MRALAIGLLLSVFLGGDGRTQSSVPREAESLAAWARISGVFTHPRCLNGHQLDTPLQDDGRRIHFPPVVRGTANNGAGAMPYEDFGERMKIWVVGSAAGPP